MRWIESRNKAIAKVAKLCLPAGRGGRELFERGNIATHDFPGVMKSCNAGTLHADPLVWGHTLW